MEGSAEEHDMVTQDVRVDNENVGENVTSSDERQCAKVSNAEEKPPASSAIDDLTTGDFILDKVDSSDCRVVILSLTLPRCLKSK